MTAAIEIIIGVGFYGAALSATLVTLASMTGLGQLEKFLPHQSTLHLSLVYPHDQVPTSDEVRKRMKAHGFDVLDWSFHYCEGKQQFQYDLVLQAFGQCRSHSLVGDLSSTRGEGRVSARTIARLEHSIGRAKNEFEAPTMAALTERDYLTEGHEELLGIYTRLGEA